jgi:hypothetical protein
VGYSLTILPTLSLTPIRPLATCGWMDEIFFSSKIWMKSFKWIKKMMVVWIDVEHVPWVWKIFKNEK